jgi:predicted adenylyl cyclase CyaB
MALEAESKFKVAEPAEMRTRLAQIGALFAGLELEKDTYYAGPGATDVTAIRLRTRGGKGLFTVKSLPVDAPPASPGIKVLEEFQVEVDDPALFGRILERLGYVPRYRKEKRRESYEWSGVRIYLDELPYLGFFLEIEASAGDIRSAAEALGLDPSRALAETYMQIFSRYKAARRAPDLELVFPA